MPEEQDIRIVQEAQEVFTTSLLCAARTADGASADATIHAGLDALADVFTVTRWLWDATAHASETPYV